ncbi:MAG: F-type H+-transporting ATPase subunit c [Bradymonadia bacterium]|jgi:F-type H+-transporting ATPase subunit c
MIRNKFVALSSFFAVTFVSSMAFAQEAPTVLSTGSAGAALMAAGLCMAIAAFGGAIGQGRAAAAALEGIARNPGASGQVFTPFILALALIESLVIYALVIAFLIQGKV